MENKILRLTTSSLFALQGAFAIFWSLYMYLEDNLRLTEMFVIGCILLLFALLFNFRKPIIKKTAYAVLVLYTIFFDVCGIMLIKSPRLRLTRTTSPLRTLLSKALRLHNIKRNQQLRQIRHLPKASHSQPQSDKERL